MSQQHALLNVLAVLFGIVAYAAVALVISSGALRGLQWMADNLSNATRCGRIISDVSCLRGLGLHWQSAERHAITRLLWA